MKYIAKATRRNIDGKADYAHVFKHADGSVIIFDTQEAAVSYATVSCNEPAYAMYNPRAIELKEWIG